MKATSAPTRTRSPPDPVILQRLDTYGVDPIGSTPAEFKQTMADDIVQWGAAIKAANIKL